MSRSLMIKRQHTPPEPTPDPEPRKTTGTPKAPRKSTSGGGTKQPAAKGKKKRPRSTEVTGTGKVGPKKIRLEEDEELGPDITTMDTGFGPDTMANDAFAEWLKADPKHTVTETTYLRELRASVKDNRPISYVVNIILPAKEGANIPRVVAAIMDKAKGMEGRVAFVFGVNGRDARDLDKLWRLAAQNVATHGLPIAVTKNSFTGKFQHGSMRNMLLWSKATTDISAAFYGAGTHPYISIQDFDSASRTVPSGAHVFNHFADKLMDSNPTHLGKPMPIRPLMMSGGYRPEPESTIFMLGEETVRGPHFATHIKEDMMARSELAKIHPLLPYSPEPNLYLDATLLLAGDKRISFGDGAAEFGMLARGLNQRYATELSVLANEMADQIARPVPKDVPTDEDEVELMEEDEPKDKEKPKQQLKITTPTTEDVWARFQIFAETQRHPDRGVVFLVDFIEGAIETDLTRIEDTLVAKQYSKSKLPQSFVPPKAALDRIAVNKAAQAGSSLINYGRTRRTRENLDEPMSIRVMDEPPPAREMIPWGVPPMRIASSGARVSVPGKEQIWTPQDTQLDEDLMVGPWKAKEKQKSTRTEFDRLSPTVSMELSVGRIYAGIPPEQTTISLHSVALSNPTRATLNGLELLKNQLLAKHPTTGGHLRATTEPLGFRPRKRLLMARGSLYDAVATSLGTGTSPFKLRDGVIDTAIKRLAAEEPRPKLADQPITAFVADRNVSPGDLSVALTQSKALTVPRPPTTSLHTGPFDFGLPAFLPDFTQGDADRVLNAHELAMRLIATHVGRELHIYRPPTTEPIVVEPFPPAPGAKNRAPVRLEEQVVVDSNGQEHRTYTAK